MTAGTLIFANGRDAQLSRPSARRLAANACVCWRAMAKARIADVFLYYQNTPELRAFVKRLALPLRAREYR
jgi:hypothetical protein